MRGHAHRESSIDHESNKIVAAWRSTGPRLHPLGGACEPACRDRAGKSGDTGLTGQCFHATLLWPCVNQKLHADRFFSTPKWGLVLGPHAVVTAARRPESATCEFFPWKAPDAVQLSPLLVTQFLVFSAAQASADLPATRHRSRSRGTATLVLPVPEMSTPAEERDDFSGMDRRKRRSRGSTRGSHRLPGISRARPAARSPR